jgi:pyoverdine/dityrosine biosynthesis protein Dit1
MTELRNSGLNLKGLERYKLNEFARRDEHGYAAVGRNGEVITDSGLSRNFSWPSEDPRSKPTPERLIDSEITQMIDEASRTTRFDWVQFERKQRHLPAGEKVLALLNHRAFQFNSREAFGGYSSIWRHRITTAVREGRQIEIVLPVFCVISNPVKRFQPALLTAAEDISLLHMANIARLVGKLHEAGAVFHLVSDSTFYSTPFGVTSVEAQSYIQQLRNRISVLGIDSYVRMYDMSELLGPHMVAFQESFDAWCRKLKDDPLADGISEAERRRWLASMMASINIRKLGLSYGDLRNILGADNSLEKNSNPHYDSVALRAEWALTEYRAVKLAATELQWEDRFFPDAVRATIHTKRMPVLGLRVYPEYKFRSNLLPYHGIGVISYSVKSRSHRLTIEPEMFVNGRDNVTRVVDETGTTVFYYQS